MTIPLDSLVENSFVLSVNEKRLKFFYGQWEAAGLPPRPKHVRGIQLCLNDFANEHIKKQIGKTQISCMSSQLMVVSMARAMRLPFVCFFEDDAVGCVDVKDRLAKLLADVPDDTDVLILGNTKTFGVRKDLGNGLISPTKSFGAQSYVCMRKNYDYFIDHLARSYTLGLVNCGENVYIAKDILFCQYSYMPETNQEWNKNKTGFFHDSLSKDYIAAHFKLRQIAL